MDITSIRARRAALEAQRQEAIQEYDLCDAELDRAKQAQKVRRRHIDMLAGQILAHDEMIASTAGEQPDSPLFPVTHDNDVGVG